MGARSVINTETGFNFNCALACSAALAVPLAIVLLFKIRASVRRFMRERARTHPPEVASAPAERPDATPLEVVNATAPDVPVREEARALFTRMRRARWKAAALYSLAGLAASLLAVGRHSLTTDTLERGTRFSEHLWPVALTVTAVALSSTRARIAALLGTLVAMILVTFGTAYLVHIVTGREDFEYKDSAYVVVPTLLILLVENRWLKTVAPLVVMLMLVPFVAWTTADNLVEWAVKPAFIGLLVAGLCAVLWLVRAYERKYFSDLSFHIAFIWIVFGALYLGQMAEEDTWWVLGSLALYALLTRLTLPLLRRAARKHPPARLLVLRVFGAPGKTQSLFQRLGVRWRYVGPIHLIAGADSATANLDLSEAVRYLTGRFRSLYVSSDADLDRRLANLDCAPDPDGRYRINDFFCFDDTWKRTFAELLLRSDAVLVDLSSYGPENAGVAFELAHLLGSRPLDSFVLVTDRRTDVEHLRATLQSLWRRLDSSLPNAQLEQPVLRILHRPRSGRLVAALCDAAVAGGWRDEPQPAPA